MAVRRWAAHPAVPWALLAAAVAVTAHAIAFLALTGLQRAHTGEVLAGVEVAGTPAGGLDRAGLEAAVRARADAWLDEPVRLRAEDGEIATDRAAVGGRVDADATAEDAWRRGRRGLWRALIDQIAARAGATLEVGLRTSLDRERLDRAAASAADRLSREARPAEVTFEVVEAPDVVDVEVRDAEAGVEVDAEDLTDEIARRWSRPAPVEVDVPAQTAAPVAGEEDVASVRPEAERAVADEVTLVNPTPADDLVLAPAGLARVLSVEAVPDAPAGERLELTADAERLRDHLGEDGVAALETDPAEAHFHVVGDEVEIEGGTSGFEVDLEAAAQRVSELAVERSPREGELPGATVEPDRTRQEAEELGIEEEVSSFTTPLVPGQPRNHNIHLGADLLDETLIEPGERFSLNEAIGPRTRERGFRGNGYIDAEGELVSAVGGGSSQLGTTFLNAAWFAGIEIVEFKPHSYYFERYPMGREATLDYGALDVVVVNDSPHGLLIATSHSPSSVTIRLFGTAWAEVDTWTGEPYDVVEGERRNGFTVDYGRTIHYPGGTSESESYTHRYRPQG